MRRAAATSLRHVMRGPVVGTRVDALADSESPTPAATPTGVVRVAVACGVDGAEVLASLTGWQEFRSGV